MLKAEALEESIGLGAGCVGGWSPGLCAGDSAGMTLLCPGQAGDKAMLDPPGRGAPPEQEGEEAESESMMLTGIGWIFKS